MRNPMSGHARNNFSPRRLHRSRPLVLRAVGRERTYLMRCRLCAAPARPRRSPLSTDPSPCPGAWRGTPASQAPPSRNTQPIRRTDIGSPLACYHTRKALPGLMRARQGKDSTPRFVVCIDNTDYEASLELHKIYPVVPDPDVAQAGDLRIVVDESGEDYLYSADRFVAIDVPKSLERAPARVWILADSERHPQPHLHDARFAGAVNLARVGGGDVVAGAGQVGVVEGVEHFPAVLEFPGFAEPEGLE